jgi:microcystin-dependent protein
MQPWTQRVSTTFAGNGTKTFKLPITLDGAFTLQASRTPSEIVIKSGSRLVERVHDRKRIHYKIACRDKRTETLRITVKTTGKYTLKASYAG